MPEITDAQEREYRRYQELGTPDALADKVKKVTDLEADNKTLRDERKDLKTKVPADGAVVLTGENAARWQAAEKVLPAKPDDVAAAVVLTGDNAAKWKAVEAVDVAALTAQAAEADGLKKELGEINRRSSIAAAVEALGWPKETVATIHDMKSLDGATWEVKTEKVRGADGKDVDTPVPYLTLPGEGAKAEKLADFVAKTDSLKGLRTSVGEKEKPGIPYRPDPARESGGGGTATAKDHENAVASQGAYTTL
jgi:hypothetical protein